MANRSYPSSLTGACVRMHQFTAAHCSTAVSYDIAVDSGSPHQPASTPDATIQQPHTRQRRKSGAGYRSSKPPCPLASKRIPRQQFLQHIHWRAHRRAQRRCSAALSRGLGIMGWLAIAAFIAAFGRRASTTSSIDHHHPAHPCRRRVASRKQPAPTASTQLEHRLPPRQPVNPAQSIYRHCSKCGASHPLFDRA